MPLGVPTRRPDDAVFQPGTGQWHRPVELVRPDKTPYTALRICCEECWEIMPTYEQAPSGYVSPDSNTKLKAGMVDGHACVEAVEKCVCYDCWRIVFERITPAGIETPSWDHRLRE